MNFYRPRDITYTEHNDAIGRAVLGITYTEHNDTIGRTVLGITYTEHNDTSLISASFSATAVAAWRIKVKAII